MGGRCDMNIDRYEKVLHREADAAHEAAQQSGLVSDYIVAAQLYEKCGDFDLARICREAAERLRGK